VAATTLVFGWILWPFSGAILWAIVLAILFEPLHHHLQTGMPRWRNLAALATVLIIVVMVLLPLALIAESLVRETTDLYKGFQSGELTFKVDFEPIRQILPIWLSSLLNRIGLPNVTALWDRFLASLVESREYLARQALSISQVTVGFLISLFVMLYLLFFLLRDGRELSRCVVNAIPLRPEQKQALLDKFTLTVRAIIKGTAIVALVQGALGGLIFWFLGIPAPVLWGAVMGVLSLLPILGSSLVWIPVVVYLLLTAALWQGLLLLAYGVLVIGLVDNILRPILIGHDTKIPDYMVLVSTLGGIATFGANGLVIGPIVAAMFIASWGVFAGQAGSPVKCD
jgi:predicted PurR-regulated permease PerM